MVRHAVALQSEIPAGERKLVTVAGRPIVVFNIDGEYFALLNRCPHQGASLCHGLLTGLSTSREPGTFEFSRSGEFLRCPWHGWEFDVRTGESFFDPLHTKVRAFSASVQSGEEVVKGPYRAETFKVRVEENYLCIDM